MAIITRFDFEDNEQITALLADENTNHLWTAFAKNASNVCLLKKQGFLSPYQTYYSLTRYVDEITALAVDSDKIYVAYDDASLLGEILSKSNPLTVTTELVKGAITEAPIDVITSDGYVFYLIPGSASGTNAKLVKYDSDGTLINTIDLGTVTNARAMTTKFVESDGLELDDDTDLLFRFNGADGTAVFTDETDNGYTILHYNQTQIDTDQYVFGGSSCLFDGSGDYISVEDSFNWDFGSGAWTIDFRVRFNDTSGNQGFLGRESGGSSYFYIAKEGDSIRVRDIDAGLSAILAWTPEADRWYHIAIVRSGNEIKVYVDGTQLGSTISFSGSLTNRNVPLFVGTSFSTAYFLNGWLDDFRVSKGVARWTTDFLLPKSIGNDIWIVTYDNPVQVVRVYEPFVNTYGYETTDIV